MKGRGACEECYRHPANPLSLDGFCFSSVGLGRLPQQVREWWEQGLRVVSLSHYGVSRYSDGTGTGISGGLLTGARELLRGMEALGMVLDVSHTSDESIRQELDAFAGPVLSSHQNCRALVPGERQMPDDLLRRIIERGAVIGSSMDTWMLLRSYEVDWADAAKAERREVFPREAVTLDDYADHIDHVCQLAGNSLHAAIGGDTDGQGGSQGRPMRSTPWPTIRRWRTF